MIKFDECPKVGDRVYGRMLAMTSAGVIERMAAGTVWNVEPSSAEPRFTSIYVDGDKSADGLDWGCHSYWCDGDKSFPGWFDELHRVSNISSALDAHREMLDNRRAMLCQ